MQKLILNTPITDHLQFIELDHGYAHYTLDLNLQSAKAEIYWVQSGNFANSTRDVLCKRAVRFVLPHAVDAFVLREYLESLDVSPLNGFSSAFGADGHGGYDEIGQWSDELCQFIEQMKVEIDGLSLVTQEQLEAIS